MLLVSCTNSHKLNFDYFAHTTKMHLHFTLSACHLYNTLSVLCTPLYHYYLHMAGCPFSPAASSYLSHSGVLQESPLLLFQVIWFRLLKYLCSKKNIGATNINISRWVEYFAKSFKWFNQFSSKCLRTIAVLCLTNTNCLIFTKLHKCNLYDNLWTIPTVH